MKTYEVNTSYAHAWGAFEIQAESAAEALAKVKAMHENRELMEYVESYDSIGDLESIEVHSSPVSGEYAEYVAPDELLRQHAPELLAFAEAALLRDDIADSELGDLARAAIAKAKGA